MSKLIRRISEMDRKQKGSALLVTLMLIVGLSMLGLGFVAMSETESSISVNQRNYAQAQTIAEAGSRMVADWFNQPERMDGLGLMPGAAAANDPLKPNRFIDTNADGTDENIGRWKQSATLFCCDKPFKPDSFQVDRIWGTFWNPDVLIDETTAVGRTFLTSFNNALFPNAEGGQVTEIRIYAPPIVGAVNTPNDINGTVAAKRGYYDRAPPTVSGVTGNAGVRYGLATIAVTAQVRRVPGQLLPAQGGPAVNRVLSERTSRVVISEWPFPGPQGPIQSNANIQTGGNVVVHWGKMTSQGSMFVKRDLQGLPWLDAHTRLPVQYGGYDTALRFNPGTTYQQYDIVQPATDSEFCSYIKKAGGAQLAGATQPPDCTVASHDDGIITWTRRSPARYQIDPGAGLLDPRRPWLYEILDLPFEDPWVEVRSFGAITNTGVGTDPQPYDWTDPAAIPSTGDPIPALSNWFQNQDHTVTKPSKYKEVIFPKIDYRFWKDLALAGQGTEGVFYFRWVAGEDFTDGRQTRNFQAWTNTAAGASAGFYFFDTKNGQNPQVTGGDVFLTPDVSCNAGGGNPWTMMGFIYLNAASFGTQGVRGVDTEINIPGEPFLDEGYLEVDQTVGPPYSLKVDGTGKVLPPKPGSAGNRVWEYDDANANGKFDMFMQPKSFLKADGTTQTSWLPVTFYDGCTILDNVHDSTVTCTAVDGCCSEPFEPYLNLQYPVDACCSGGSRPNALTVGWQAPNAQTRRMKKRKPDDSAPTCTTGSADLTFSTKGDSYSYCSSNYYDRDGEVDAWTGVQDAPVLNGVFYNEGEFDSQGNARYFGSVLINGDVGSTGTNEVWFDERLIKDEWPPASWPFPRVFITAVRTDDL